LFVEGSSSLKEGRKVSLIEVERALPFKKGVVIAEKYSRYRSNSL